MHTLKHKEGRQSATIEKNPTTNSSLKKRPNNYTMYISHLYRREHDIQKKQTQVSANDLVSVWVSRIPPTTDDRGPACVYSGVTILPLHPSPSPATSHNQLPRASPSPILSNTWPTHETRRAPALNCASPSGLKVCTDQLAPIFTLTLNRSLELYAVPCCFKYSSHRCLQETPYNLVKCCRAVTLVLTYLQDITICRRSTSGIDLLQFAFQSNRSVDNTINVGLH